MPPDGPDTWPKADSRKQWLVFYKLDDMTFTGTGTIEGNGQPWWDLPCKPHRVVYFLKLTFFALIFDFFFPNYFFLLTASFNMISGA